MLIQTSKVKKVSFLGPEHTFSNEAANIFFENKKINFVPVKNFGTIVTNITSGIVNYGVMPFFNPYEEHIRDCQEKIYNNNLIAIDTCLININLCLASSNTDISSAKLILSKEQVFTQCDIWLKKNMHGVEFKPADSTASAAKLAKENPGVFAICSTKAAIANGLTILYPNIQNPKNFTLFFLLQNQEEAKKAGWNEYSYFCIKLKHHSKIKEVMDILSAHRLKSKQKWDFEHVDQGYILFFLECESRYRDLNVVAFEAEVRKYFPSIKLIGSFERSINTILEAI